MKTKLFLGAMLALVCGVALATATPHAGAFTYVMSSISDSSTLGFTLAALGTIGVFDTTTLLDVLRVQKSNTPFWLTKCFPFQINFETEKIAFDRVNEDYRRLAPFVSPNVQGKVMTREGSDMLAFKPAYVKPKHVVTPDDVIVRQPGEALGTGSLTREQRREAVVADILRRQKEMHLMTREWLAARAIIDGKVTIEGENYPKVTVDFRRDASLTVVLTGGAKWDAPTTAAPLADIKSARVAANTLSGAVIRDIVFGANAWALFSGIEAVQKLLDKQTRGSESDFTKMTDGFEDSVEYLGTLQGTGGAGLIRMWLYSGKYRDEAGTLQDILDTDTVVGVDFATVQGHRCFGAIADGRAGFQALDMFPKNWEDEDPWVEYLMTQSAPLMVPKQPNASFSIKVK
jgi:hypothetical protein